MRSSETIRTLHSQGMTAERISETTGDRLAFVRSVIYRLEHADEFIIPKIEQKPSWLVCPFCKVTFKPKHGLRKYCSPICQLRNKKKASGR